MKTHMTSVREEERMPLPKLAWKARAGHALLGGLLLTSAAAAAAAEATLAIDAVRALRPVGGLASMALSDLLRRHMGSSSDITREGISLPDEVGGARALTSKWTAVVAENPTMDDLVRRGLLSLPERGQPFPEVATAMKPLDPNFRMPAWIALGWIAWQDLGPLRAKGGCQRDWTRVCAEQLHAESFVIKHVIGHKGWKLHGVGIAASRNTPSMDLASRFMVWAASPEASKALRDYFVVVPNEQVRLQRKVVFELWSADRTQLLATTLGRTEHPLPVLEDGRGGFGTNVCGGPKNACPPYQVTPEIDRLVRQAHGAIPVR